MKTLHSYYLVSLISWLTSILIIPSLLTLPQVQMCFIKSHDLWIMLYYQKWLSHYQAQAFILF